jgi:hypothetical protein
MVTLSNIEHSKAVIDAVKNVVGAKIAGVDAVGRKIKALNDTGFKWTDAVSPTQNNLDLGKSTTCKEAYLQFKEAIGKKLKEKGRPHDSSAIGSEVKDVKNSLMRIQDPELFSQTSGNLSKVAKVEIGGKAEVIKTTAKTAFETGNQMAKNKLAWVEKNKEGLGEQYATIRNAVITMIEASGYKR